ncbi:hypothetical protein DV738_g3557, partial [Chaetothyriales sp. CBS 135597]
MASTEPKDNPLPHPHPTPATSGNALSSHPAPDIGAAGGESDPDFDDLDDVLDQFSANAPASQAAAITSGPGRPDPPVPSSHIPDESEDQFLARLTEEMSEIMSKMEKDKPGTESSPEDVARMGKELEEFTFKMEAEGVKPEDLLKAILGEQAGEQFREAVAKDAEQQESQGKAPGSKSSQPPKFEDTIRRTMERMEDSSNKAASAAQEASDEDMLANLMKTLGEAGGGGDGDMSKMLLGMMEQLTNKEMLYEPMEELNQKFPAWLERNKDRLTKEDYGRYTRQRDIVREIVSKFEEKGYSDDDPLCREFIWEKMQKMQDQGAPPEDLVQNPMPGMNPAEIEEGVCYALQHIMIHFFGAHAQFHEELVISIVREAIGEILFVFQAADELFNFPLVFRRRLFRHIKVFIVRFGLSKWCASDGDVLKRLSKQTAFITIVEYELPEHDVLRVLGMDPECHSNGFDRGGDE